MKKEKYNVVLADCPVEEVQPLADGIAEILGEPVVIETSFKKLFSKRSLSGKIRYYSSFFTFAFNAWRRRGRYKRVFAWQQFYAQNFAFFARLLGRKTPDNVIVSVNFTYKEKPGIVGRIYRCYMKFCTGKDIIDRFHVLSPAYAGRMSRELSISPGRFIVTPFGTPDRADEWRKLPSPVDGPYVMAIGRSNRNFDFLCDVWRQPSMAHHKLIIIANMWTPRQPLPDNVVHLRDVIGDATFPYFANAAMSIVPVDDPVLCSGDTVLLNSMMMGVPVAITAPSTLSEMYVTDGVDGLYIPRDAEQAAAILSKSLDDPELMAKLGEAGRNTFTTRFSRHAMGRSLAKSL